MLVYSPTKIVELRKERGLTQSELARKARPSAPTVWALEKGETKMPKLQTLKAIAEALGVPMPTLYSDKQPADIDERIHAAATALEPQNKAALLAAALALLENQKKR